MGSIGPRPIAFASTIDASGKPNLSPYSFFNVFSANPPIMIFSPARRVRNNTTKHTLENALATKEVVINVVNYAIVQQMSLSSTEYAAGVNEFEKAGLTMLKSDLVKPFRVKESPVQYECKVNEVVALGKEGGAGNLIIAEVVKLHVNEAILTDDLKINQYEIDLVARMGGNWYTRANLGMFEVPKPLTSLGIGVDSIPQAIRNSKILSGNDLGQLGNIEKLPNTEEIQQFIETEKLEEKIDLKSEAAKHEQAKKYINNGQIEAAWITLLA
ncbi:flavin reductase [Psychroflexus salis]|uniref:Flavin reductase n=1 Tax=Psychroflexus salis TaxID=1526574 RepID=A0A916ZQZ5_9FLAO|nr:flavin reductase [Psychroflexus salis]